MITLYRTAEDSAGREIQQALQEACLAHEVVLVTTAGAGNMPEGLSSPALVDDGQVYQERGSILARLEELRTMRERWHKYGADACYCDDEGNVE